LVPRPRPDKKIPGYGNIGLIDINSAIIAFGNQF
jgi:hypothetical protein